MKVMQIQDEWGPEYIKLAKRPDPAPSPGETEPSRRSTRTVPPSATPYPARRAARATACCCACLMATA